MLSFLEQLPSRAYFFLSQRRRILFPILLLLMGISVVAASGLNLKEDVLEMLPDDGSGLTADFQLIRSLPLAKKILINLEADSSTSSEDLDLAVNSLVKSLDPQLFVIPTAKNHNDPRSRTFPNVSSMLPSLFDAQTQAAVETLLLPENIRSALKKNFDLLNAPEGAFMQRTIRKDPLFLSRLVFDKMALTSPGTGTGVIPGEYGLSSADGRHFLLSLEPRVPMTDASGSRKVVDSLQKSISRSIPDGIKVNMAGAHLHTTHNVSTIKSDLGTVMLLSSLALVIIFFAFIPSTRAIPVFLVPFMLLPPTAALTFLIMGKISGITVAFGSVLMGIAIDYSIYVYYGLNTTESCLVRESFEDLARPVLLGYGTSIASFAALLFSNIPCIRQIAVFSIIGLSLSILFSFFILPHFFKPGHAGVQTGPGGGLSMPTRNKTVLVTILILCSLLGIIGACNVRFNSDLQKLSAVSPELIENERYIREKWGGIRELAVYFSSGKDMEESLQVAEKAYASAFSAKERIISIIHILPSEKNQGENILRWKKMFTPERIKALQKIFTTEAVRMGFTPDAFNPFFESLAGEPEKITRQKLADLGLAWMLDLFITNIGERIGVLTFSPDTTEALNVFKPISVQGEGGYLSPLNIRNELTGIMRSDFIRFVSVSLGANVLLLLLITGNLRAVLLCIAPLVSGLSVFFGVSVLFNLEMNIFHVVSIPLIFGIGVDYGVFMVCHRKTDRKGYTGKAVLLAGLTTLAGFAALIPATHPALNSIGMTATLGIAGALIFSLLVIPSFTTGLKRR